MDEEMKHNAYASPVAPVPKTEWTGALWRVEGDELWVRDGASFPDLDLVAGEIHSGPQKAKRVHLQSAYSVALLVLMVLTIMGFQAFKKHMGWDFSVFWIILAWYFIWLLFFSSGLIARVSFAQSGKTRVALLRDLSSGRQLRVATRDGHWFCLKNVAPVVIEHLRGLQRKRLEVIDPDVRTFTMDLSKFSLPSWFHFLGWKPFPCLNLFLRKSIFRVPMIARGSIPQKAKLVSENLIEKEFRDEVAGVSVALEKEGWVFVGWEKSKMVDHEAWIYGASLLDPSGTTALVLSRLFGAPAVQGLQVFLRSHTLDGRLLRTVDAPDFPCYAPNAESLYVKGNLDALIRVHQQRVSLTDCVCLKDVEEWMERAIEQQKRDHAYMQEKGVYGPLQG